MYWRKQELSLTTLSRLLAITVKNFLKKAIKPYASESQEKEFFIPVTS